MFRAFQGTTKKLGEEEDDAAPQSDIIRIFPIIGRYHLNAMTDAVVDSKSEVKQATKYVKETENVAEKYSAMTVSKNSDMNMNVGELPSAAFTAVPTLKSVKKVRGVILTFINCHKGCVL